jgi:TusA-related sulfurtransferase
VKDRIDIMDAKNKYQLQKTAEGLYTLDIRGLTCPYPQLLVMRSLNKLSSEDLLEVILDNPPSVKDIPPALERKGYKIDQIVLGTSTWKLKVQAKK